MAAAAIWRPMRKASSALKEATATTALCAHISAVVSAPYAGLEALAYFDPPETDRSKPKHVGDFPAAVFGTMGVDGKRHGHRIYLASGGAGKADLGIGPSGRPRDPKKSCKVADGDNTSGRSVLWGDVDTVPWIIVTEGIETAAAVAHAFREEIGSGQAAVAAAITTAGVEAFLPWPSTSRVTIAADRDERVKPGKVSATKAGECAARAFGVQNRWRIKIDIALPGKQSESVDWLDVLMSAGVDDVRAGILAAVPFVPTEMELAAERKRADRDQVLAAVAAQYPLPPLNGTALRYDYSAMGGIMVHKAATIGRETVEQPIATPFGIPARLKFLDQSDAFGLRLVVQDMGGTRREIDIERAGLAKTGAQEIRQLMFAAGLRTEFDGDMVAVSCLKAANPQTEIKVVRRPGWHDLTESDAPFYVCPDGRVLGAESGDIELSVSARIPPSVSRAGTLDGWKDAVAAAHGVPGCEHWALGVIAGFAGVLVNLTGLDTCGINYSGLSSSGKTTAQKLAVSAWSRPVVGRGSLLQSAKATVNSVEVLASRSNGTALVLDELAHVGGRELGRMIYTFAGGAGKTRMGADALLKESYAWSTFAMISSEVSLEEKVRSDGGEWTAGMAVRIVDIDVTGVTRTVPQTTLDRIAGISQNYGHAGPSFIQALVEEGLHRKTDELRTTILELARRVADDRTDSATIRAAQPFGILFMAGRLAKCFGLLPASVDLPAVIKWAWARFLASSDAMALDPVEAAIGHIRAWIAERWLSSVRPRSRTRTTATSSPGTTTMQSTSRRAG
jgi:hypothetical protein